MIKVYSPSLPPKEASVKIINKSQNKSLAQKACIADTAVSRLIGLLNRSGLNSDEALIITQCRSIHMFFMRFAIDVIFVNKHDIVVGLVKNIRPFRMSPYFFRASYAIELPPGTIDATQTQLGDVIVTEGEDTAA